VLADDVGKIVENIENKNKIVSEIAPTLLLALEPVELVREGEGMVLHIRLHFQIICMLFVVELICRGVFGLAIAVSLPRKAMVEMGFHICCIMCDAQDNEGLKRCVKCIEKHKDGRSKLDVISKESKLYQLAVEMNDMLANPSRHSLDHVHGNSMDLYMSKMAKQSGKRKLRTLEEVIGVFEKQREEKGGINYADQSKFKNDKLSIDEINKLNESMVKSNDDYGGTRTIPSRDIPKVDRSERPGEIRKKNDGGKNIKDMIKDIDEILDD